MRPNLLLVVFDTARRDAFEPYGAAPGSSPTVAQLAAAGAAHPHAYTTGCWTIPGHGSMFTGLLPRSAGLGHVGMTQFKDFPAVLEGVRERLLPAVLAGAGYETSAISTNGWISRRTGFAAGFDRFVQLRGDRAAGIGAERLRDRLHWQLQALRARCDDGARIAERTLEEWVRSRDRRPFFWFVNLMECHSPYLPPKPFNGLGPLGRLRAAREAARHLSVDNIWRCCCGGFDVAAPALERMRRLYADSIRELDAWLARVLELLDRHGLLPETQVVVTSDHGENIGEGELLGHAFSLDDRLLRVPLVTSGPGQLSAEGTLSLASLPRVLAGLIGLEDHPWQEPQPGGVAVAEFDAPGLPGDQRVEDVLERWQLGDDAARRLTTSFTCATDGALKLIRRGGAEELIVLAEDPLELRPRPVGAAEEAAYGPALAKLRGALDAAAAGERRVPAAAPVSAPEDPDELAQLEAQMRLLGYM